MLPACDQSTSSCEIKLRELEIDSYSKILAVFRARGNLTNERRKLLKQICTFLNISQERHRAEVRRVTGDDLLSTIAERLTGQDWTYDWNEEGKRLVPTPTPFTNYTVNTPFADYIASVASLGKKYVDLYNKRLSDSVPNNDKSKESLDNCEIPSEKWLNEINEVYAIAQKEKVKDVSVQTIKKKIVPKKCTYCERRKELRKKKLEAKEKERLEEEKRKNEIAEKNVEENKPEVDDDTFSLSLPSGKQIFIENAFDSQIDDLSVSVIAQEVTVETEPTAGPSYIGDFEDPCIEEPLKDIPIPFFNLATPDFTGLNLESSKVQSKDFMDPASIRLFKDILEDPEKSLPPRIPRILNSGPKKKVKKQSSQSHSSHKHLHGEKYVKKKGEYRRDSYARDNLSDSSPSQFKYSKSSLSQMSTNKQGHSKLHQNTKPSEGLRQYDSHKHFHEGHRHSDKYSLEGHKHALESHKYTNESHRVSNESICHHYENLRTYESKKHGYEGTKHLTHRNLELSSRHQVEVLQHIEVPKIQEIPSKPRETLPKHHEVVSKQHEVILKHHEGMSQYPEVVPKRIDSSPKQTGGIYKHYVRVRHTPKAPVPYMEIKHHTEVKSSKPFGEPLDNPTDYLQIDRPLVSFDSQMEVVDINDFRLATAGLHHGLSTPQRESEVTLESLERALNEKAVTSLNFLTSEAPGSLVEEILAPSSESSLEGRNVKPKEESCTKRIDKVYNGESKAHASIHFHADHLKDLLHKFPNTQISHMEVNNGCQMEDSSEILPSHNIWDGALSGNEFIMENVSIVDEGSFPIANGHEEIILEEEVLTGSQIIENLVKDSNISSLVEKSEVCVIPQADMKFSVVDLTDYSSSMENICSVSSQSKDDSRDSDIVMNRRP